jgi:fucose permease
MRERDGGKQTDGLVWGLLLIGMGVCFMLMMYNVLPNDFLQEWWALFVIAAGLGSLVTARNPKSLGSGVTTLGTGCWLLVASNGWYGLGWARSWPLVLVAVGLGSLARALAGLWWRESEVRHEG